MKKRGFTLTELIAVIVILAIIALVAIPVAINQIEETEKDTYVASVKNVFDAVTTFLASNTQLEDIPSAGIYIPEDEFYKKLDLKNQNFTNGRIYRDEDGILKVENISDGTYCASGSKNELSVTKGTCDNLYVTAPSIYLRIIRITTNSITVAVDSKDKENGIINYKYYINGKLVKEKQDNVYTFTNLNPGEKYKIYATATNVNNKTGASEEEEISTETTAVTFKITPEDWSHSKTVTITFPKIEGEGYQYQYRVDDESPVTVEKRKIDIIMEKPTTLHAEILKDGKTFHNENIFIGSIDNTPPAVDVIDEINDQWAVSKNIKVTVEDKGVGVDPTKVYSLDEGKTWEKADEYSFDKKNWFAYKKYDNDIEPIWRINMLFTKSADIQKVSIMVRDALNNTTNKDITVKNIDATMITGASITAKTADGEDYTGTWTNQSVTLYAIAKTDSGKTPPSKYKYQWYKNGEKYPGTGSTLTLTQDQQAEYKVGISTVAGAKEKKSKEINVKIDKINPTCSWSGESTTWIRDNRTIQAKCNDNDSKCTSDTTTKDFTYSKTTKTATPSYTIKDKAGNSTTCEKEVNVYVDKTAPTIVIGNISKTTKSVTIPFIVTDDHSGVNTNSYTCVLGIKDSKGKINYNITGKITKTSTGGKCTATNLEHNTTYYYKITAKDNLENIGTKESSIATQSLGNIEIKVSDETSWTTKKTVTIKATNSSMKGYLQYRVTDLQGKQLTNGWVSGTSLTINQKSNLYVRLYDGHNTVEANTKTITKIDKTSPTISYSGYSSTTKSVTLKYTTYDAESGVKINKCYIVMSNTTQNSGSSTSSSSSSNNVSDGTKKYGTVTSTGCTINDLNDNTQYNFVIEAEDKVTKEYSNKSTKTGTVKTGNFGTCNIEVPSGWAKSKKVTITGSTAGAALQYRIGQNGTWTNIITGGKVNITETSAVYCRLWDGINESGYAQKLINIDKNGPSLSNLTNSSNGSWTNQNITVKVNATDYQSGISYCEYKYADDEYGECNNTWCKMSATPQNGVLTDTYSKSRNTTVYIRCVDKVGNVSNEVNTPIKIDKTSPSLSNLTNSSNGSWTSQTITVKTNATDSYSGISYCEYKYAYDQYGTCNNTWCKMGATPQNGVLTDTYSQPRNTTAYIRCIDRTGNVSNQVSTPIRIDTTAPNLTLGAIRRTTTGMILPYTATDNESGISNTICQYGISGYDKVGTISGNTCIMNNLTSGKTYLYKITTYNGSGLKTEKTGQAVAGKKVTVIFHSNDGNGYTATQTFTYGVSGNKLGYENGSLKWGNKGQFGDWDKTGYTLAGWSESSTATSASYSKYSDVGNDWIDSKTKNTSGEVIVDLYAVWKVNKVTVKYHINYGNGETVTQDFTYGVSGNKLGYYNNGTPIWGTAGQFGGWDRTGYTLLGWAESSSAKSKDYEIYSGVGDAWINQKAKNTDDGHATVNLYAVWKVKSVKVEFYQNITSNEKPVSQTFTYGVSGNKFGFNNDGSLRWGNAGQFGAWDRSGYDLLGWSESSNATSASYNVYSGVSNNWINSKVNNTTGTNTVKLYAVWRKSAWNDANTCDWTMSAKKSGNKITMTFKPKESGCKFKKVTNTPLMRAGLTHYPTFQCGTYVVNGVTMPKECSNSGTISATTSDNKGTVTISNIPINDDSLEIWIRFEATFTNGEVVAINYHLTENACKVEDPTAEEPRFTWSLCS